MSTVVRSIAVCAMMLAVTSPALAQQPARPDAHHPPQGGAAAPGMTHGPGARRGEGHDMMAMCREMMGGMGPMGMRGPMDPKQAAQMMEMRGEMMKAMGEIMMKHAQRLQQAAPGR